QVMDLSISILNQLITNWRDMVDLNGIYVQYKDWQSTVEENHKNSNTTKKNGATHPSSQSFNLNPQSSRQPHSSSATPITHTIQIFPSSSALFFQQDSTIQWSDNASFGVTQIVDSYYNLSFSTHPITKRILKTRYHHAGSGGEMGQSEQQMAD